MTSPMHAVIAERYGRPDVIELRKVDRPVATEGTVVVQVVAAAINPYDWHMLTGTPYLARLSNGIRKPKSIIPGVDMAGRIVEVGAGVERWQVGDEVIGPTTRGALAEYTKVAADKIVAKPANVGFDEGAAVVMAGISALQALRDKGHIAAGQSVLVNGASGGVGIYAIQLAKHHGAEVTGVCSTRNIDLVRSLGADDVVDYTVDDYADTDRRYDIIFDNNPNRSLRTCKRLLTDGGTYVIVGADKKGNWIRPMLRPLAALVAFQFSGRKAAPFLAHLDRDDLQILADMLEAGTLRSAIDRTYELADTADAFRYLAAGHARGKVIINP